MKSSINILCLTTLFMGLFIGLCSDSWFGVWVGLELNMLGFVPLAVNKGVYSNEGVMKYLLIQFCASFIFLISSVLYMSSSVLQEVFILMSMVMKLGGAPLHFWFADVMSDLDWGSNFVLMTFQKVMPLVIIEYMYESLYFFMYMGLGLVGALAGSLSGINVINLKKLMGFSSVGHLGWMLIPMVSEEYSWVVYFVFYSLLTLVVVFSLASMDFQFINKVLVGSGLSTIILFSLSMLSLGGLPPLWGFLPKLYVMSALSYFEMESFMVLLVLASSITIFYYMRVFLGSLCFFIDANIYSHSSSVISSLLIFSGGLNLISLMVLVGVIWFK